MGTSNYAHFPTYQTYNVGPLSYVCWFINPMNTIVIGIINRSYWSYVHQLSYHRSAINPMKCNFSYTVPMNFPCWGPHIFPTGTSKLNRPLAVDHLGYKVGQPFTIAKLVHITQLTIGKLGFHGIYGCFTIAKLVHITWLTMVYA